MLAKLLVKKNAPKIFYFLKSHTLANFAVLHGRERKPPLQCQLLDYSLMQFLLETGRTHQIRVHCAYDGHPLVGDSTYGTNRSLKVNLSGQALHARQLSLLHPISGELINAIAPLPAEFEKLLQVLRNRN